MVLCLYGCRKRHQTHYLLTYKTQVGGRGGPKGKKSREEVSSGLQWAMISLENSAGHLGALVTRALQSAAVLGHVAVFDRNLEKLT